MKVIEYLGERDFPGWYKEAKKFPYGEDARAILGFKYNSDYIQLLRDMDGVYAEERWNWEKKLIKNHKAKFTIELHDTPTKRNYAQKKDCIDMELLTSSSNVKLLRLLADFCIAMKANFDNYGIEYLCANSALMYSTPYNQIVVEIAHDPFQQYSFDPAKTVSNVIVNLLQYMQEQYPRL